ncbi:MAG: dNTP triphosphohydrolase [Planctomycetes bacterium]|nr:dNTP triphosphohydrolase [Planctomycetota bacterium]
MSHPNDAHLAPYAVRSDEPAAREHPEPADPLRGPFELDRHRIIESTAFRRLEGKTQVFATTRHDHFRTRLTHTLEASEIARCLAVALRANEPLAEAITLAHDLGHPPFGHAGEAALNTAMSDAGGFNHNAHSLRIVEYLEHPFPPFRGLNLTAQTRLGLACHETRYDDPSKGRDADAHGSPADHGPSVEAQVASLADRIAYNLHDLEDAIGAELIVQEELAHVALWADACRRRTEASTVAKSLHAIRRVVLDELLNGLLGDAIAASRERLTSVRSTQQVRASRTPLVTLSSQADEGLAELERFLVEKVYRHREIVETDVRGRNRVLGLFDAYRANPRAMPGRFTDRIDDQGIDRVICDYIAGMTDRFCTEEHRKLER